MSITGGIPFGANRMEPIQQRQHACEQSKLNILVLKFQHCRL
jgi:hypothetical protein